MSYPFNPTDKNTHLFADCRGKCMKEYGIDKLPCGNDFTNCVYKITPSSKAKIKQTSLEVFSKK